MARKQVRRQSILYRLTLLHHIIHDTYSTQDTCNAKYNSSRLLGLLHKLKLLWYVLKHVYTDRYTTLLLVKLLLKAVVFSFLQDCHDQPVNQMLLMLGAVYSGRVEALGWAAAGPNHTPSVTLLCQSVLASWQSAHAGHQNHRQKSPRVLPGMPNFSRICFRR